MALPGRWEGISVLFGFGTKHFSGGFRRSWVSKHWGYRSLIYHVILVGVSNCTTLTLSPPILELTRKFILCKCTQKRVRQQQQPKGETIPPLTLKDGKRLVPCQEWALAFGLHQALGIRQRLRRKNKTTKQAITNSPDILRTPYCYPRGFASGISPSLFTSTQLESETPHRHHRHPSVLTKLPQWPQCLPLLRCRAFHPSFS